MRVIGGDVLYQILICDDEARELENEYALVREIVEAERMQARIVRSAGRAALLDALTACEGHCLLLLDILLGGDNGVALARELRATGRDLGIIFVTTSSEYILEGYDVHAIQYLIKPLDRARLHRAILYDWKRQGQEACLEISGSSGFTALPLRKILYVESVQREVLIHTEGQGVLSGGEGFSAVVERLPPDRFRLCHRTICVNLDQVQSISNDMLALKTGERLPVGRRRRKELRERFIDRVKQYTL